MSENHLFCFGFGFSASTLAARLSAKGWRVTGTSRTVQGCQKISDSGAEAVVFDGSREIEIPQSVTHILVSVPPGETGDVVLRQHRDVLAKMAKELKWLGYLSTTGVYGNRDGDWVDETSELLPSTTRGERRVTAERAWIELFEETGLPLAIFRLAGIYGPGRNQLVSVAGGKARRVVKPGQVFSRIHVDDIARVLEASIHKPDPGRIYNVCDDDATPPQEVVAYAARLLGMDPPPEVAFDDAEMSPMGRSFYSESKKVSNSRIKQELGVSLAYPGYREGLQALFEQGTWK